MNCGCVGSVLYVEWAECYICCGCAICLWVCGSEYMYCGCMCRVLYVLRVCGCGGLYVLCVCGGGLYCGCVGGVLYVLRVWQTICTVCVCVVVVDCIVDAWVECYMYCSVWEVG